MTTIAGVTRVGVTIEIADNSITTTSRENYFCINGILIILAVSI